MSTPPAPRTPAPQAAPAARQRTAFTEPSALDLSTSGPPHWSFCLQGPSGGGKTHCLLTFPQPIIVGVTETNIAVIQGFRESGVDVTAYPLETWEQYQWFVRKTKNREWDAQTVGLDTYGLMGTRLVLQMQETGGNLTKDGNLKQALWNTVKNDQWREIMDFVGACAPRPNQPAYHIVVCVHEYFEQERRTIGANPDGSPIQDTVVTDVLPEAPGSFRESFGARFDCVFIANERARREKDAKGIQRTVGSEHILWTVPPDDLRHTKDGVGGKAGRRSLPPTVENTFPALCKGWGIDPQTLQPTNNQND